MRTHGCLLRAGVLGLTLALLGASTPSWAQPRLLTDEQGRPILLRPPDGSIVPAAAPAPPGKVVPRPIAHVLDPFDFNTGPGKSPYDIYSQMPPRVVMGLAGAAFATTLVLGIVEGWKGRGGHSGQIPGRTVAPEPPRAPEPQR